MTLRQCMKYSRSLHTSSPLNPSVAPLACEIHHGGIHNNKHSQADHRVPIIFLHGFLGSKRENRLVSRLLARDLSRQVYALDLRNHGDSGHHTIHNYMAMALDVEAFIKSREYKSVTVIGHSMGAKTACTLALHAPDLISNVVAIDNGPVRIPIPTDFQKYLHALSEVNKAKIRTHSEGERILAQYEESAAIRLWLLSNFVKDHHHRPYLKLRIPVDILSTALDPLGDFPYTSPESVKFQKPTLFLRSHQSHYLPDHALPLIRSFFPQSQVVDMDCGHWVVQDRPEDFRRDFLRS
ncbi:alpha/beta hydrolase, putative [Talaromyces stipitatus ATCC 10500]|uniref:Alpha/beta hydrolase, putative n=1 Tax=Talaromyces stipitatus (strain ATCC 10500 / CBS 375.48 / QM 6759 / NRRL 1006) TaxID=441959 RepID=B8M0A3_TALSN|nr:alpha/beta hydrolase, putative [Talaromyces stipitatus ATCC 10500]EED21200.1 alpha/beta hydrolase, putative [Talaromyces stipitatus ATCC 10500]